MRADPRELVDPAFFSKLENIELRARSIVEGFLHGLHRSPWVGSGAEFSSHRQYVPGDDPRHVNWKLYARQKRLYVKQYEARTNLHLHVLLDVSGSMDCASTGIPKLQYGAALAAAMAHLALRQRDAVALTLFADTVVGHLPARSGSQQLDAILAMIGRTAARPQSNTGPALHRAAELARHRGLVVVISDLFGDSDDVLEGLLHLRHDGHEVLVFQVLDPWERDLPLDGHVRFRDMESGETITTHPAEVRERYLRAVTAWREELETECRNRAIDRVELTTDAPLDGALLNYLVKRAEKS